MTKCSLNILAEIMEQHLHQSLFCHKVAGFRSHFIKNGTLAQAFSCKFYEIFKNTYFVNRLRKTVSVAIMFTNSG